MGKELLDPSFRVVLLEVGCVFLRCIFLTDLAYREIFDTMNR